jgi:hypothetical protein
MKPDDLSTQETIDAIRSAFGRGDPSAAQEIPKSRVLEWMRSPDLEVRGALYSMVTDPERASHIAPALQFDDYYSFVLDYLEQCIETNPEGEWVDSRYLAGHQLVAWIIDFWNNKAVPRARVTEVKDRVAAVYKRGDADVRDAVVNGVLEHLFEHKQWVNYFRDWEQDPVLASAYRDGMVWTKKAP